MPLSSNTVSPSRCSSKASAYWNPEHPPPRTPTRRPAASATALWASRNSRTFSAPLSVRVIMLQKVYRPVVATLKTMSATPVAPDEIRDRIEAGIPGAVASVTGDGHHFNAVVSAPAFAGLPRIAQHRLVYDVFGAELGGRIHALSIQTR